MKPPDLGLYDLPRSPKELRAALKASNARAARLGFRRPRFTCDECPNAASCALAYDLYNTNGDCLLDK